MQLPSSPLSSQYPPSGPSNDMRTSTRPPSTRAGTGHPAPFTVILADHLWSRDRGAASITVAGARILCIVLAITTTILPTFFPQTPTQHTLLSRREGENSKPFSVKTFLWFSRRRLEGLISLLGRPIGLSTGHRHPRFHPRRHLAFRHLRRSYPTVFRKTLQPLGWKRHSDPTFA